MQNIENAKKKQNKLPHDLPKDLYDLIAKYYVQSMKIFKLKWSRMNYSNNKIDEVSKYFKGDSASEIAQFITDNRKNISWYNEMMNSLSAGYYSTFIECVSDQTLIEHFIEEIHIEILK